MKTKFILTMLLGLLLVLTVFFDSKSPPVEKQNVYNLEYEMPGSPVIEIEQTVLKTIIPEVVNESSYIMEVIANESHNDFFILNPYLAITADVRKVNVYNNRGSFNYITYIRSNKEGNANEQKVRHVTSSILLMKGLSLLYSNKLEKTFESKV